MRLFFIIYDLFVVFFCCFLFCCFVVLLFCCFVVLLLFFVFVFINKVCNGDEWLHEWVE